MRISVCLMLGLVLGACSGAAKGSRPDDMSVAGHREASEAEAREAEQHEGRFDPDARATRGGRPGGVRANLPFAEREYNPTAHHESEGAEHREHARQHEQAAKALEAFEDASCSQIAPTVRGACPLGAIAGTTLLQNGVRLTVAAGTPVEAVVAHMRCHVAYARSKALVGMDGCALYLRGLQVALSADGKSVEVTSDDPEVVKALQARLTSAP